jgi:hypothetical protein
MIKDRNQMLMKVFMGAVISMMICTTGFTYVLGNGAGGVYGNNGGGKSLPIARASSSDQIEYLIQDGGGYFLDALSGIFAISNRIETADIKGVDYDNLQKQAAWALENIKNAKETYARLIPIAEATPYLEAAIYNLAHFEYETFMIKYSLNVQIFKEVEGYLKKGDITGAFKRIYAGILTMEKLLISINGAVKSKIMPGLSVVWQLNEVSSGTLLFGQYLARVFAAL